MPMRWRAWLMSVRGRRACRCRRPRPTPEDGSSSRFRQRSRVDLPDPEGPITKTSSRSATCRSTPFRTMAGCAEMLVDRRACLDDRGPWRPIPSQHSGSRSISRSAVVRGRVVARHAGHAIARRDRRSPGRPAAGSAPNHFSDSLAIVPSFFMQSSTSCSSARSLGLSLRHRRGPMGARVRELEVGDEQRVLARRRRRSPCCPPAWHRRDPTGPPARRRAGCRRPATVKPYFSPIFFASFS